MSLFLPELDVRGDIILLNCDEEPTRITDVISNLLTRDPKQIAVPKMDAKGNVTGVQVIWISNSLIEELNELGMWPPVVEEDEYGEKKVYVVRS